MLLVLSKLVDAALMPLSWVALLLVAGLPQRSAPYRRALMACASVLLLVLGWEPLPDALMRPLEARYPELAPSADLRGYRGVVVLGGALEPGYLAQAHATSTLNEAAERMTQAVALAHRFPHLQILFTGGDGDLLAQGPTEATRAREFFHDQGLDLARVRLEDASRTTQENAVLGARLLGAEVREPWLLLTSAWHMPRAMGAFQQAGWNVRAYPVDFRTAPTTPWSRYSLGHSLRKWHLALHEYVGLLAYRITQSSTNVP